MKDPKCLLRSLFDAAVAAADPAHCLPPFLPAPPRGRTIVVGAGKASAAMARTVERHWPGKLSGLVATRYGHGVYCERIEIVEAGHPLPDAAGLDAARRMFGLVSQLSADDLVLGLFSGGGSALLPLPLAGVGLADKQAINAALLRSGAPIDEINCVRRHLSAIKGGRLGAACNPAAVLNLLISDVPGDDPINIASGPMVGDPTTCQDALAVIDRYRIKLPDTIRQALRQGRFESIKRDDPRLAGVATRLVATPQRALEAAAHLAQVQGWNTYILSDRLEGEARVVGADMAALALRVAARRETFQPPCILLSGGETTVTVSGSGRGGRNVEFLLSLAIALGGHPLVYALAGDTDGIDGVEPVAGAYVAPDTLVRATALGIDPQAALANNDAHSLFDALGDSVITGPTLTNVNDFRAILVA